MERPAAGRRTVALVGLRCTGKTSVGRSLAVRLGRPFVDLDERTAARGRAAGWTAPAAGDLLAAAGLAEFRRLEADALDEVLDAALAAGEPIVLATGGGVVETPRCRGRLARDAVVAWLTAGVEELGRRLRSDPTARPSLTGADPVAELAVLLKRRAPLFREVATWTIDCGDRGIDEVAAELHTRLRAAGAA
ncbi:MAG: shikimate kinase [Planctomycetota bacterium]